MIRRTLPVSTCAAALFVCAPLCAAQQVADPDFNVKVERPAYPKDGPTVAIDEAHGNFHTASGRYKPLADLLTNDGYVVKASTQKFDKGALDGIDILIISNANAKGDPAFTEPECDVVRDWVRNGGSLLLIADHAPYGAAAANLGARFGVTMGKGWVFEPTPDGLTTQLTFSRKNGRLGIHPALSGRDSSEEVKSVTSFTGQSLGPPEGAAILLRLGETAKEASTLDEMNAEVAARKAGGQPPADSRAVSVGGRAQGLAMASGKGRVVVLGEAAMFSAQIATFPQGDKQVTFKMGMNMPGNDDRQFALNVLHWLSRLLP